MRALILVDLQNDFLPGGALAIPRGDEVIAVANRVAGAFELVVATRDWHPANHGSFVTQHAGRKVGEVIDLDGLPQVLWPVHCVQHTPGAELAAQLDVARIRRIIDKGVDPRVDSYSGFFDNGRRRGTGLDGFLREHGVEQLYVLGLATDYCVKATALDAVFMRFTTYLVEDGCRGVGLRRGDLAAAVADMRRAGVRVVESSAVR